MSKLKWKKGQEVWLKANKEEGWKRERATIIGPSGKAIMVQVNPTHRLDDGLREIDADQIED